jgi:hypothetical protein
MYIINAQNLNSTGKNLTGGLLKHHKIELQTNLSTENVDIKKTLLYSPVTLSLAEIRFAG